MSVSDHMFRGVLPDPISGAGPAYRAEQSPHAVCSNPTGIRFSDVVAGFPDRPSELYTT